MAASDEQVLQLRRMVAEPTDDTYSDTSLAAYIEAYPRIDEDGFEPDDLLSWTPTYDLAAAAGAIWVEKGAALAGEYDFSADGGSFKRSQAYEMAMKQARYWNARRTPTSMRLHVSHDFERDYQATPESVVGGANVAGLVINEPEPDDE